MIYKCVSFLFVLHFFPTIVFSQQAPKIEWQKCLGGSGYDVANCIIQTSDGGFAIAAYGGSTDGDVTGNHGLGDAWIVKLDPLGKMSWRKCYGGSGDDYANWIIQTSDGGYAVAGRTDSPDGDVKGLHGTDNDAWVFKLNSSGDLLWQKCLGGTGYEGANYILRSSDGGYVICGVAYSNDGDVHDNHSGPGDAWVVKLDSLGNLLWQKCIGGTADDEALSIIENSSGGYTVAGRTSSKDGDIVGYHGGDFDALVFTLDSVGNTKWVKCYGGDSIEHFHSIIQTPDKGYAVSGHTNSMNGDVTGDHGGEDGWVVKLDSAGNIQWEKSLGGSAVDGIYSIKLTKEGGYIGAGFSSSTDGDVSGCHGEDDMWIVKLNTVGNIEWQKCLGGSQSENANSIALTSDDGYAIAGFSTSNDGDVTGYHGGQDAWIVKLAAVNNVSLKQNDHNDIVLSANPVHNTMSISYSLDKRTFVKLEICNLLGQNVQAVEADIEDAGTHIQYADLSAHPVGSYFVRFTRDGRVDTKGFELIK